MARNVVLNKHWHDEVRANRFIRDTWQYRNVEVINQQHFVTWAISTTMHSTILILTLGLDSCFTRNTYSEDPDNPWLIFQHACENEPLAQYITAQWQNMNTRPGQREQVDLIAKHVVYELVNNQFELRELNCDEGNIVRVHIKDIEIWSHPPRDEPLRAALVAQFTSFTQKEGNVVAKANGYLRIRDNPNIPPQNIEQKLNTLRNRFNELYKNFYEEVNIPSSYEYPTLQLAQNRNYDPNEAQQYRDNLQRYGGTFAGVYETRDNEAHMKFHAQGVEPRGLPSKEDVFNALMEGLNLNYADIFNNV